MPRKVTASVEICEGCPLFKKRDLMTFELPEGFEAADPATAAALLTFDSAVDRYTPLDTKPLPWRAPIDGDSDSSTAGAEAGAGVSPHSGHAGTAPTNPQ